MRDNRGEQSARGWAEALELGYHRDSLATSSLPVLGSDQGSDQKPDLVLFEVLGVSIPMATTRAKEGALGNGRRWLFSTLEWLELIPLSKSSDTWKKPAEFLSAWDSKTPHPQDTPIFKFPNKITQCVYNRRRVAWPAPALR